MDHSASCECGWIYLHSQRGKSCLLCTDELRLTRSYISLHIFRDKAIFFSRIQLWRTLFSRDAKSPPEDVRNNGSRLYSSGKDCAAI